MISAAYCGRKHRHPELVSRSFRLGKIHVSRVPANVVYRAVINGTAGGFGPEIKPGLGVIDDSVRELPTWVRLQYRMECRYPA